MTTSQIIAVVIITGIAIYFLYDVIRHAVKDGGSVKQIIARILIWILVFVAIVGVNVLINADWGPGKWLFRISF